MIFAENSLRVSAKLIEGIYMQQNPTHIAKSTKLSSLFFRQQKNAHSTKLEVKKIVCSCSSEMGKFN